VVADSAISNAYLVENGKVISQFSSINAGVVTFSGLDMSVAAGQTRKVWLAVDLISGLSAGNTVAFAVESAAAVSATDATGAAVTASGAFPLNGGTYTLTTVSSPAIASVGLTYGSVGTSVNAGTQQVLVAQMTSNVQNSAVKLSSINFKVTGSASKSDIRNVKLYVNGTQVGNTLPAVAADGSAYFDLSSAPATLQTGSANVQLFADVMGSPSYNFTFNVLNNYDVYAMDTQYNVPVSATISGTPVAVTINPGAVTLTLATDSPTTNIAKGGSNTVLAKFSLYAAGEPLRLNFVDLKISQSGSVANWSTASDVDADIRNIRLVDDAGQQIGSTISTMTGGTGNGQCTLAAGSVTCHFGTSGSNINYLIPANTTRVISAIVDVQTTADFTSVTAEIPAQTNNLRGQTSSQLGSTAASTGSARSLAANSLSVSKNGALGNTTYAAGSQAVKIGSYTMTASSAEGVNLSNITVTVSSTVATSLSNLHVKVGTTMIGIAYPTVAATDYSFSGNIQVPQGGTAVVDVYASINTGTSGALQTIFKAYTGTGAVTYSAVTGSSLGITGQTVTAGGSPTLTVGNNNSLGNRQIVMGTTGVSLAKLTLTDTAGFEPIRVQSIKFNLNTDSAVGASFGNLVLKKGSEVLGTVSMTSAAPSYVVEFTPSSLVVPQGGAAQLELVGDVTAFTVGNNIENSTTSVTIGATANIIAYGQGSNAAVTISGTPSFVTLTTLRGKLNLAGVAIGSSSNSCGVTGSTVGKTRSATDNLTCLTFTPDGPEVRVQTLSLTFTGAALSGAANFSVSLLDPSTGSTFDGSSAVTTTGSGQTRTAVFSFTGTPLYSAKSVYVRVNSSGFADLSTSAEGLDVTLNASTDVSYGNGSISGSTASGLGLSSDTVVPLSLTSVTYN
jgi:hypothetical protein